MLLEDFTFYPYPWNEKYIFNYGNLLKPYRKKSDFVTLKDDQASLHKIVLFTNEWLPTVATRSVNLDIFFLSWMTHTMSSGRTSVQERLGIREIIIAYHDQQRNFPNQERYLKFAFKEWVELYIRSPYAFMRAQGHI